MSATVTISVLEEVKREDRVRQETIKLECSQISACHDRHVSLPVSWERSLDWSIKQRQIKHAAIVKQQQQRR